MTKVKILLPVFCFLVLPGLIFAQSAKKTWQIMLIH